MIALAVALAPVYLRGFVKSVIEREVGARVNGVVTVDAVQLGWFSPQRVEGLSIAASTGGAGGGAKASDRANNAGIDAASDAASDAANVSANAVRTTVEISEGLVALLTGDAVTVRVSGSVRTPIDADGGLGIRAIVRADPGAKPSADAQAGAASPSPVGPVFGGRKVRVEIDAIDVEVTSNGEPLHALDGLRGHVAAADGERGAIVLSGEIEAGTRIGVGRGAEEPQRKGAMSLGFDLTLGRRDDGSIDLASTSGSCKIDGSSLPLPSPDGDVVMDAVRATASLDGAGLAVEAHSAVSISGSAPATVDGTVRTGTLFGAGGAWALDPAGVEANVSVKQLPLAVLQPFGPELAPGTRLDFLADVGETADFEVVKNRGGRASINFDARRLKFAFDGVVAPDGSRIEDGTLAVSASARPELLAAVGLGRLGVDAEGPLVVLVEGSRVAWSRSARPLDGVGGSARVELARPIVLRGRADAPDRAMDLRADSLRAEFDKPLNATRANVRVALAGASGVSGADRPLRMSFAGEVDLAPFAVSSGTLEASVALDPKLVERWSEGAVIGAPGGNTAKLTLSSVAYRRDSARSLPESLPESLLDSLDARGRVSVDGELKIVGAASRAAVRDLSLDFALPRPGSAGSLDLSARIDGAETRLSQRFDAIPAFSADPLAPRAETRLEAINLAGTVDVRGLDPSVVARFLPESPQSKDALRALGAGPLTLSVRNRTEGAAVVADFTLAATSLNASGRARYASDAISASDLACEAALTPALIELLKLPDSVAVAPGARASLRVPSLAFSKANGEWRPSDGFAGRVTVDRLRVERAPGLTAALDVPRLEVDAAYVAKEERATAKGFATLGAGGSAGRLGFDLAWRKPVEAKLFRGVEGAISLSQFDLARVEGALGLEQGAYSGLLGGAGDGTVEIRDRGAAQAKVTLSFPKVRGAVTVDVVDEARRRVARASGSVDAQIAAETFAAMAGIGKDPKRRVTAPVDAKLVITSAQVPLDEGLAPVVAEAALELKGSLSPVSIEVADAQGKKSTVSTGALALSISSVRLSDEVAVRVTGDGKAGAQGVLDLDARLRGAVARTKNGRATPVLDATVKATRFPAATIDALAGTRGAIGRYLGDMIDAEVVARNLSTSGSTRSPGSGSSASASSGSRGTLAAKLTSPYASVDAPALALADGFLTSGVEKPMRATFVLSPTVREQLLTPINPVFADVTSKDPARFTLTELAWPLDGDRRTFDAAFTLEAGQIQLTNSGPLSFILGLLGAGRTEGFEAQMDPLRVKVARGRLTYRDFALRVGRTQQGSWRNSLVFSGDVDLAATPIYANEIKTVVPLADAANWSRDARGVFDSIQAASPQLLKSLTVGVRFSGPLYDASGRPATPNAELALPDIGDVLRDNPGVLLDGLGDLFNAIRKRNK